VRTTAIRGTAAAVLLSATLISALGWLAGCVNAEQSAPPGAGQSQSYGPAPTTVAPTGSPSGSVVPAQAGTDHNAADITFVDQAVQLRQQAASLATKATTASTDSRIQTLATAIAADVVPSVSTMTGWLTQWGAPTSVPGQIPGLLTDAQVQQLESATGTPFDMQWLQAMNGNLQASQAAAQTEVSKGTNAAAKQLAQQWLTELKSELTKLRAITG